MQNIATRRRELGMNACITPPCYLHHVWSAYITPPAGAQEAVFLVLMGELGVCHKKIVNFRSGPVSTIPKQCLLFYNNTYSYLKIALCNRAKKRIFGHFG